MEHWNGSSRKSYFDLLFILPPLDLVVLSASKSLFVLKKKFESFFNRYKGSPFCS